MDSCGKPLFVCLKFTKKFQECYFYAAEKNNLTLRGLRIDLCLDVVSDPFFCFQNLVSLLILTRNVKEILSEFHIKVYTYRFKKIELGLARLYAN